MMRISTWMVRIAAPPVRSSVPRTKRRNLVCSAAEDQRSVENTVPPSAASSRPGLSLNRNR